MPVNSFRPNHPHIIHEIIQGEAILVNLQNGKYYSADGSGAEIWDAIEKGVPLPRVVELISAEYDGPPDEIRAAVYAFADELVREGLIVAADTDDDAGTPPPLPSSQAKSPFTPPVLRQYTEMTDLLLLDPIHDVDDSGWPHRAQDPQQ